MTETRDPNQLMDVAPDIAPLAWVIDEIRTSLTQAIDGMRNFLGTKQDLDSLRGAANQVHQAHGALQLLDLRGVALVTEAIEQLLRRWEEDPLQCQPAAVRSIESAITAVLAYLDGLLAGRPNQPIRLFPYYRDVLVLSQSARVHPADLMFPDLTRRPAFHQIETRALTSDQLRVRRVRFEEGLLGFLRDSEDARARRKMREALGDLEMLPQRGLARSLWWVVRGLLEALDARDVPVDTDLKRVLARLNLQLRRLIDGVGGVAERLMVDALYYVGRAGDGTGRVAEVKRLYGLQALMPEDFERATLTTVDAEAQRLLKEALTQTKTLWGQIVTGGVNAAADTATFAAELQQARNAAMRLDATDVDRVLAVISDVTRNCAQLPPDVREPLALEVASSLLFVELGIDHLPHDDDEFAHRATQVTERLQTAQSGGTLPDSAPWLSALARRAQDRLTMATVVSETQTTLREIEQRLDRFFRNPADKSDLPATLPMFDQVCGVLSVLGFSDPVAALRSVQQSVRTLAEPASRPVQSEFTRIAGNLGAVGFFIESLSQDTDRPRGMFRFDPATGVFSADLTQVRSAETVAAPEDDLSGKRPELELPEARRPDNVEAEALRHVDMAYALAQRLVLKSNDNATLEELARLLPQLASEADLLDDSQLKERIARAAVLTTQFGATRDVALMRDLATLLAPPAAPAVQLTAPLPESQDDTDRELHDIFVEEAREVLDTIESQLEPLRAAPANSPTLTTVRRAFHTLKGSSRMVGLKQFGEGAWAVEQCFNLWLAQERPANDDLIGLAATAHALMREWIAAIDLNPSAAVDVTTLVNAAQRVREGAPFEFGAQAPPSKPSGSAADQAPPALPKEGSGAPFTSDRATPGEPSVADDDAAALPPDLASDENVKRIGPVEISHGLYSVFLNEADECIRTLAQDVAEWRFEPARPVTMNTVRRAHSLGGISATVGLASVWQIADPLDNLMHELARRQETGAPMLSDAQFGQLETAIDRMRGMLHQFAASIFPNPSPDDVQAIQALLRDVQHHGMHHVVVEPVAANDQAVTAESAEATVPAAPSAPDESALAEETVALDASGITVVEETAPADWTAASTISASAPTSATQAAPIPSVPMSFEAAYEATAEATASLEASLHNVDSLEVPDTSPSDSVDSMAAPQATDVLDLPPAAAPVALDEEVAVEPAAQARGETLGETLDTAGEDEADEQAAPAVLSAVLSAVRDELDPDLLPVFLAEGHDLLPAIGAALRALAANPNDHGVARELMRHLHTAKGSARMAGAMRLGELVHEMETRIESAMQLVNVPPVIVEDLQSQYDQAVHLFEKLQSGPSVAQSASQPTTDAPEDQAIGAAVIDLASLRGERADVRPAPAPSLPLPTTTPIATTATAATAPIAQTASFIRVRADVLDKLVDQAGEVSIARSKLENEVGTLKGALLDLTENIGRLRTQLREVEIQADAQIQARADQLAKESAAFDPLEFDRYTRLQELTRMLAESVEDVAMVQSNMLKGLTMADTDLTSQSRLTRELQQQLMRVRLVPFQNVAERLYRVARQTAKELDKRVNLEFVGGSTEIDRGVLERMGGPFEHLVRNAIVHGLERPVQRVTAGKRETGELSIEVKQEGNEIVVVFADDGAGLNLGRIRERGIEKGLVGEHQVVSDRELMELIFAPGFSTATEVTELAGRGVGMDVVRAELSSFGGRVAVSSEPGQSTRFTLYLPLTLAVTQVVLVTVGGRRYAIPAGMVEQVRRYKPAQLLPALGEGTIQLAPIGEVVLRPLAQLLGVEVVPHHGKQSPIVLLRSGDDRLAIAVDDLSSNQEVVVKNVGTQVSRLAGVLGATILGDGEIVLILNPVQLITRAPEPPAIYSEPHTTAGSLAQRAADTAAAERLEGPPVVMVVDDSLTVRRVTQRLLERNGFDVLLAKDGVDALRQLQDAIPDAMLVDIEMPRMDGFDLTRNVRSATATRDIPIVMITSRTAEKHRSLALSLGVNEYLGKPYQEEHLLGLLRRYIAARAVA